MPPRSFARLAMASFATAAFASSGLAAPRVAVDIAPIHSIAAAVMAGVGAPDLIVPPGASEHDHALRPSEAAALAAADLVIWVGPTLTPWLADPIAALAGDAALLEVLDAPGLRVLPVRVGGPFAPHRHEDAAHDDHAEAESDHAHDDAHEDHAHDAGTAAEHDRDPAEATAIDPHLWLDPANAAAAATAMADALGALDPANAGAYAANAVAFTAATQALGAEIDARLAPHRGRAFFVFHDAYQYFETRFALPAAGSLALNSADAPRASRVAEVRARLADETIDCIFTEPQFEPKLIATLIEGTPTRTGALDPLGADLPLGPALYPALLRGLSEDLAVCLEARS